MEITELDRVLKVRNMPIDIIEMALKETIGQYPEEGFNSLQVKGLTGAFDWSDSELGHDFWLLEAVKYST